MPSDSLWQGFLACYEAFTGVLCAAGMSGCDAKKEARYAELRGWFGANYFRLAPHLRPALEREFAGDVQQSAWYLDATGQKGALDPLESLFLPLRLKDVLIQDSGDLIPRIARISDAVYRCREEDFPA